MIAQTLEHASPHRHTAPQPVRTIALVGRYAHQRMHELVASADYDVLMVESTTHAYSKIKRARPDLVIVCLFGDDSDACRVLSMLALDSDTAHIPVLTVATPDADMPMLDLLDLTASAGGELMSARFN
jgi:DNA-binding response OmpR family regulator